ncbi:hypothetical protein GMLC_17780 [Geomonas limicola]|uniref:Uncharacterized protein n=1 Tax=Geomonas limicola TaxID=2740186 RepID=A0A6V8NAD4_9BACT|nr:hypothetical protein GMLC_17780 [Geomonas limicola]
MGEGEAVAGRETTGDDEGTQVDAAAEIGVTGGFLLDRRGVGTVSRRQYNTRGINDTTKPSARMGRKAYRVSPRQPGRRNI